jgi:hypothetical protein
MRASTSFDRIEATIFARFRPRCPNQVPSSSMLTLLRGSAPSSWMASNSGWWIFGTALARSAAKKARA